MKKVNTLLLSLLVIIVSFCHSTSNAMEEKSRTKLTFEALTKHNLQAFTDYKNQFETYFDRKTNQLSQRFHNMRPGTPLKNNLIQNMLPELITALRTPGFTYCNINEIKPENIPYILQQLDPLVKSNLPEVMALTAFLNRGKLLSEKQQDSIEKLYNHALKAFVNRAIFIHHVQTMKVAK